MARSAPGLTQPIVATNTSLKVKVHFSSTVCKCSVQLLDEVIRMKDLCKGGLHELTPSKRIDDVFFSHFQISVAMAGKAEVKLRPLPHVTILPAHGFLPTADRAGSGGGWDEEEMETAIR